MNRTEFMKRLEQLLWDISDSEREEALQYYNDYFDDAGVENETVVLRELGSPQQVAEKIKAGFSDSFSEYTEQGYEDTRFRDNREIVSQQQEGWEQESQWQERTSGKSEENAYWQDEESSRKQKWDDKLHNNKINFWKILAIALLCILGVPVIIPIGITILSVVLGFIIAAAAVVFGLAVPGIAIMMAGIAVIGAGITRMFVVPAAGLLIAGVGCLLFALGIIIFLVIIWCVVKVVPWVIRGIVSVLSHLFRKAGAK